MESSEKPAEILIPLLQGPGLVPQGRASARHSEVVSEMPDARSLMEEVRKAEMEARLGLGVLNTILDLLPVGVTVQSKDGKFLLVNNAAAAQLAVPAVALIGASSAAPLLSQEAIRRQEQGIGLIGSGAPVTTEDYVVDPRGDRVFLTAHKPVRICDETLLLSTSLDITERKLAEIELSRRAYFDELTRLPNRCLIQERVESALERRGSQGRFALAFIDIDNFKYINDYYSHAVGDTILVKVAQRIADHIRASDMLARMSGDEFLLLLEPVDDEDQLLETIDRILQKLKEPFYVEGFEIFASASIGVSICPEHGQDYETLCRNADSAMYQIKSAAKGGAAIFDHRIGQAAVLRMEQEQRLRLAVRDSRFCCAFQPKVDIHTQEVVGVEALIRLRDESGVIQAPSEFIGLAVELGLIDDLTHLVLNEIMGSLDVINDAFGSQTTISVNVAAKQAGDLNFMRSLAEALQATECASRFMIEVTEDAFVAKSRFQAEVLPLLRELGVGVSIDDFGTGYSSLSALADITADEIKIDRSFITDIHQRPRSQSVLRAIESLGDALGMTVIAEGVETFEELAYLRTVTRIRYAQGYYFAKPLYFEDLTPMRRGVGEARAGTNARGLPETRGARARSR